MKILLGSPRVLDLTDGKGVFCGKILADLGAIVIKVEKPGGDPVRNIGPFYHNMPGSETSLYWFAFNAGKKSVTLDIEKAEGKRIFKDLVRGSEIVVESFPPGYLDKLGIGYSALSEINPRLIMASITPFGQTGPYRDYEASDLTILALSGLMSITGDSDRPPIRFYVDQTYYKAGVDAAVGTMLAYLYLESSGEGQHVDVAIYESAVRLNYLDPVRWEVEKHLSRRMGSFVSRGESRHRVVWPCREGFVSWWQFGGVVGARDNRSLVQWMDEEGMAGKLKDVVWEELDMATVSQEELCSYEEIIGRFFSRHTKKDIFEQAVERGIRIFPIWDMEDVLKNEQLAYRGFWNEIEHRELGATIAYPGSLFLSSELKSEPRSRAPFIGEHNQEVYEKDLGLSKQEVAALKKAKVI